MPYQKPGSLVSGPSLGNIGVDLVKLGIGELLGPVRISLAGLEK